MRESGPLKKRSWVRIPTSFGLSHLSFLSDTKSDLNQLVHGVPALLMLWELQNGSLAVLSEAKTESWPSVATEA